MKKRFKVTRLNILGYSKQNKILIENILDKGIQLTNILDFIDSLIIRILFLLCHANSLGLQPHIWDFLMNIKNNGCV